MYIGEDRWTIDCFGAVNLPPCAQNAPHWSADIGIEMDWVNEVYVRKPTGQLSYRAADTFKAIPKVFPAMAGDQDNPMPVSFGASTGKLQRSRKPWNERRSLADLIQGKEERVNDRVTRYENAFLRHSFANQILPVRFGRGKVKRGEPGREHSVCLLWPRRLEVACAQPGFDVPNGNVMVKGSQRRAKNSGSVTLYEHQVWFLDRKILIHRLNGAGRQICQRLIGAHQIEVCVWFDLKNLQHLIKHLPVLTGYADVADDPLFALQCDNHRSQLDGLGASAENNRYFHSVRKPIF
jgi:hypothetical protein